MASYKWRSIALIFIMHVYKCMQIQIAFRQNKITKTFLVHVYIFVAVFHRVACFDFNDFHIRM